MQVERIWSKKKTKGGPGSIQILRAALSYGEGKKEFTLHNKLTDINKECPQLLGVSPALVDYVLFCD